jgi:hemolysin III
MSRVQTDVEERANTITHAFGAGIALLGWGWLLAKAVASGSFLPVLGVTLFCVALVAQFLVSAFYHSAKSQPLKRILHVWDHALIYVLIAGSYSPFALVTLRGPTGWKLFAAVWGIALLGILFKLKFTGRLNVISTLIYLAMGWMCVTVLGPLSAGMTRAGLAWLVVGGLAYSVGALVYLTERLRFNHVVWHVFVMIGGVSHLVAAGSVLS